MDLTAYLNVVRKTRSSIRNEGNDSCVAACIRCRENVFTEQLLSNDRGMHIHRLSFDPAQTVCNMMQPTIPLFSVFVATETCLPRRCQLRQGDTKIKSAKDLKNVFNFTK
jgi:hypothetical protein